MNRTAIVLLCVFILGGCAATTLPPITSKGFVFEEDEKRLWNRSEEEQKRIDRGGLIYSDDELEAYLNQIAGKLQPPDVLAAIPFKILVIQNPLLNAFAFPNGVIYVHTGMLARMENEAQFAALLAHEMTHVTHRHAVKGFRDIKNKTAFLAAVQVTLGGLTGGISGVLGAVGTMASVTGYSKELETEADMEGLKLIMKAGYDPGEAPKLFMHLKTEIEEENRKEPFFFGTHPRLQERIDNYESFLQIEKQRGGIHNVEVFLEKTHRVILFNAGLDLRAGRFKTARRGAEKYLGVKPDDAKPYYFLGEIARQKGEKADMESAKGYYQKAISIDPAYPEPYKGLGFICYKQEEKSLAKKYLEQYLLLLPQAFDRAHIEEYIKTLP
jgi:beta-barrel assembly-enhancing protease